MIVILSETKDLQVSKTSFRSFTDVRDDTTHAAFCMIVILSETKDLQVGKDVVQIPH